jgi:hypothetical protein
VQALRTNFLHAGGYGRVAITAQIKAVLLRNRYIKKIGCRATADDTSAASFGGRPRPRHGDMSEQVFAGVSPSAN